MMAMTDRLLILLGVVLSFAALYFTDAAIIREHKEFKTKWELIEALRASSQIRGFNGTWITDDEFYYTARDRSIRKFNARTNTDSEFLSDKFLELYSGGTFTLSPDNNKILVRYNLTEIFRHSYIAKYDVFDIKTRESTPIHDGAKLQYCGWSPVKDRLSYVYENNVYIHFEAGLELAITDSGVDGIVYNGVPDWVYEEEVLSSGSAMWWSPDGTQLAVGFFNDTEVRTFKYTLYGDANNPADQYPKEVDLKYPKSGTPNPVVAVRVFDLGKVVPTSVTIKAPVTIVSADHILQNVAWANDTDILITWLNRRQNIGSLQLCSVNFNVGECKEVKRFEEPDGWINIGTPKCLKNAKDCYFTYWIDNWYQVWRVHLNTGQNLWKSRGNFTVLNVYGYDEINNKLYYQATKPGDPSVYHVFRNDDCLTCNLRDVDGDLCVTASATFSKSYSYYTVTCSGPNPSYTKIFKTDTNTEVTTWEANSAFRATLSKKLRPTVKFLNVTLADGSLGFAKLQLPPNLDVNKKYPMIVVVYGGPDSVRVTRNFAAGFDLYLTTNREIIYATIDGRGTGNKGKKTLFSVNNQLGIHEVEDQIYVTKELQKLFPYIDHERVGIWGWSYGGYMTARTLAADDERVFQCGISVAPVTSWLYYDTIYTERFMGLPTKEDNLKNYTATAVFNNLKNFRTHDFLLMHGSGDDNVHYQQSLLLSKMLQQNDILFEEMIYPDENHGIGNYQSHLYKTQDRFWVNCLNIDVSEEFIDFYK